MTSNMVYFDVIDEGTIVDVVAELPVVDVGVDDTVVSVITVDGPPGPQGNPGTNSPVFNEVPVGVKDGVNLVFETAEAFRPGTVVLYYNGIREEANESFTESAPNMIVLDFAPGPQDKLRVDYLRQ